MKTLYSIVAFIALALAPLRSQAQPVAIGHDVEVKAGHTAPDVVVIGGSAKLLGDVNRDLVVIGGDADIESNVGRNVVIVGGDAHLGSNAVIQGDLVTVGGVAELADGAVVKGQSQQVALPRFLRFRWLSDWIRYCVFELRPLSFHVGWVWWVAGVAFLLYLLIAVLFPHPVALCSRQLHERPAISIGVGLLVKLALPIVMMILVATIVGTFVIPFIIVAEFVALIVGKVAVLEFIGSRILGASGQSENWKPAVMLLIGALIVTVCYLVPVIGLITFLLLTIWGFGAVATALAIGLRREKAPVPAGPAAPPPSGNFPPTPGGPYSPPPPVSGTAEAAPFASAAAPTSDAPHFAAPPPSAPVHSSVAYALAMPRAGFWARMGAGFLDVILVAAVGHWTGPLIFILYVAYFAGMWAWKGTTIGGIVLNLQVVRLNGEPMDFLTAFVRSLGALFSTLVLFLGFFWIAWDAEKQAWHDKIAGTVVVRLPRPVSLVCI